MDCELHVAPLLINFFHSLFKIQFQEFVKFEFYLQFASLLYIDPFGVFGVTGIEYCWICIYTEYSKIMLYIDTVLIQFYQHLCFQILE